jgi:hypothetical protein
MNIDQYRALKAQEANKASAPAPTQVAETKPIVPPVVEETKPKEESAPAVPDKIVIEGIGEVPISELKNGYLRQSDYTQKTQEVARQKREVQEAVTFYEQLKANPDLVQQISQNTQVPDTLDPTLSQVMELKNIVYDMMLQNEISNLQKKYPDFEVSKVIPIANEKHLTNLEDAYILSKANQPEATTINKAELEKQLREQIMREMQAERSATQTIIDTHGNPAVISDNEPKLSPAEQKVARMMRLTDADYAKWRDADRKKK